MKYYSVTKNIVWYLDTSSIFSAGITPMTTYMFESNDLWKLEYSLSLDPHKFIPMKVNPKYIGAWINM